MWGKITAWVEDRFDLSTVRHLTLEKTVPKHRYTWLHLFGGLALFFFIIQVVTGILLLLYYRPTAKEAFESVKYIVTEVPFGWLIRSVHSWSANLMIFAIVLHLVAKYFLKAYRRPRELTWVTGFLLLTMAMAFGFTGYLLPWNELAFFATRVGTETVRVTPVIGEWLLHVMRGGPDVTGATLNRFFAIHVTVLPLGIMGLLSLHLLLVQVQGMSKPMDVPVKGEMKFFPNFMLRDVMLWMVGLGILIFLATYYPWELGKPADPFAAAPEWIKPEWYFLSMYQLLKWVPELIGFILINVGGAAIMLVPFLDRKASREERSPLFTWIGVAGVVFLVFITWYAKFH